MQAEFFGLFLGPIGRYRHGCDPPGRLTPFSSLPSALDSDHTSPLSLSDFLAVFCISHISQQILGVEPLVPLFRQTTKQSRSLEPSRSRIGKERKR